MVDIGSKRSMQARSLIAFQFARLVNLKLALDSEPLVLRPRSAPRSLTLSTTSQAVIPRVSLRVAVVKQLVDLTNVFCVDL